MGYLDIPEWEIEEAIARSPSILGLGTSFQNPKLVGEQVYLPISGRFIDLLFLSEDKKYVIVELKKTYIDEPAVIFDQLLPYRQDLALQLKIPAELVSCLLATTRGFSSSILQICQQENIHVKHIDEKLIWHFLSHTQKIEAQENAISRLLRRRYPTLQFSTADLDLTAKMLKSSIAHYITTGNHDETANTEIAKLFRRISSQAPLCAHEVFDKSYEKFSNESAHWFWFFYSVLDRRANAVTFINASCFLKEAGLLEPDTICKRVDNTGYDETISTIRDILANSDFPLSSDSSRKDLAMPTSIVEAALWYRKYNFLAENIRRTIENRQPDKGKWSHELFEELKNEIYGVGDRIAGQIVRGFILKDGWDWTANIPTLLEKCDFNVTFASKARLGLIDDSKFYTSGLQAFGDKYLDGNYAIISHVLWFVRKRYCMKPKRCFECPMSGYCNYYYRSLYWKVPEYEVTLLDLINFQEDRAKHQ